MEKTVNGETTKYLYETDKVVLETDADNRQTAFMAYGTNLLYRTSATGGATESYYYLYNAHGDVTSLIDSRGNIAASYDYDAFGNILSVTGDADNNILYAGYQYDKESGLYYLNARYYDSVTARFITEDTYRGEKNDPLSLNLYTYCCNNPIIYIDPSGRVAYDLLLTGIVEANIQNILKIMGLTENEIQKKYNIDENGIGPNTTNAITTEYHKYMTNTQGAFYQYIKTATSESTIQQKDSDKLDVKETQEGMGKTGSGKNNYPKSFDKSYTPTQVDADAIVEAAWVEYDLEGNKEERLIYDKEDKKWVGDNKTKYGAWYNNNGEPWCAQFVSYCANEAGVLNTAVPKYQGVKKGGIDEYKKAGRYESSNSGYIPKAGDTIFFYNTKEKQYHTGIVVAYDPATKTVYTIEGNSDNAVRQNDYEIDDKYIIGYGWNGGSTYGKVPTDSKDGTNRGTR